MVDNLILIAIGIHTLFMYYIHITKLKCLQNSHVVQCPKALNSTNYAIWPWGSKQ